MQTPISSPATSKRALPGLALEPVDDLAAHADHARAARA